MTSYVQISETKGTDGHYVDVGTQTHSFRTAPFAPTTTLEQLVVAGGPTKLRLQLQADSVSSRNNRASSAFTFICGHSFHRSEFARHFRSLCLCLSLTRLKDIVQDLYWDRFLWMLMNTQS